MSVNNFRLEFAKELEALLGVNVDASQRIDNIASWAYRWRLAHQDDIDAEVDTWLLHLSFMSMGEEFEIGDVELRQMFGSARSSALRTCKGIGEG